MYKEYLALNNQQWLICHKTQPNQTKPIFAYVKISVSCAILSGWLFPLSRTLLLYFVLVALVYIISTEERYFIIYTQFWGIFLLILFFFKWL